ncbi:MAG: polyketide cyclase [Frankiales bacterium]|nr:polyketide cyclase [Frankiales bacterium]
MWTTDVSAETAAAPESVWAALRALHSGQALSESSDRFELHGPFEVGTLLSITPHGQDTLQSRIVELTDSEVYADETSFAGLTLRFRHTLVRLASGGTRITHTLTLSGDEADTVGPELGPQISADFPAAMDDLIAAAARHETGDVLAR